MQDLTQHPGRVQAGEPRQIDGRFGVAGPLRTPPCCAMSGKTWPGIRMSPGCRDGSVIARTVAARSNALVPVVVRPSMSIETANAVPWLSLFFDTISGIRSSSRRCAVIGMHTMPRPCVTMKFRLSGVAFSAAMMKSPSFSRSASSTTITIFPARMSARASSIVANTGPVSWVMVSFLHRPLDRVEERLHVLRDHVDLQVQWVSHFGVAERRHLERVRDQRHAERRPVP